MKALKFTCNGRTAYTDIKHQYINQHYVFICSQRGLEFDCKIVEVDGKVEMNNYHAFDIF